MGLFSHAQPMPFRIWLSCFTLFCLPLYSAVAQKPFFRGLGDLPDATSSRAYDISANGRVVVGYSGSEAFRWSLETGMVGLGDLPGGPFYSQANAVSADGSVIVGGSRTELGSNVFRWTVQEGMVSLGDLPGGQEVGIAWGISSDGSVIAGVSASSQGDEAFRWTAQTGLIGLGDLPGGQVKSIATGVSGDGTVLVGTGIHEGLQYEAFRWTEANGMVGIGIPPGSINNFSQALGVSSDGHVIVGFVHADGVGSPAFRWTVEEGFTYLGDLPGGSFSGQARGVSADGSIITGWSMTSLGAEAFIWDSQHGMRNLREILTNEFGLDLTGWKLSDAVGVSADGRTFTGYGRNPLGEIEAWVAHVPEPNTLILWSIGCVAILRLRSNQRRK